MTLPMITALEIGTTTIKVLMAEVREDGGLMVAGIGECDSRGVHKGEIIDFELALGVVRHAMKLAETHARTLIGKRVYLATSGGRPESFFHAGGIPIFNEDDESDGEITSEDIDHVLEVARKIPIPIGRVRLHTLQQNFAVNDRGGIVNPEGMLANELRVGMLLIHGQRSGIENLKKLVESVPVVYTDAVFGGFCSALAVLTPEQKRAGAVVIDLGGGTTDYIVYRAGLIQLGGSIAIGGEHITADICSGLNLNHRQAEMLKKTAGNAVINRMKSDQNISIPAEGGFGGRVLRISTLNTIINARVKEIFQLIADKLNEQKLSHMLCCGIILTGGGSALAGVSDLARQVFNAPTQSNLIHNCIGLPSKQDGARFSATIGCIRYAAEQLENKPNQTTWRKWISNLWRRSHG